MLVFFLLFLGLSDVCADTIVFRDGTSLADVTTVIQDSNIFARSRSGQVTKIQLNRVARLVRTPLSEARQSVANDSPLPSRQLEQQPVATSARPSNSIFATAPFGLVPGFSPGVLNCQGITCFGWSALMLAKGVLALRVVQYWDARPYQPRMRDYMRVGFGAAAWVVLLKSSAEVINPERGQTRPMNARVWQRKRNSFRTTLLILTAMDILLTRRQNQLETASEVSNNGNNVNLGFSVHF